MGEERHSVEYGETLVPMECFFLKGRLVGCLGVACLMYSARLCE